MIIPNTLEDKPIIIATSGGADSMSLLHMFKNNAIAFHLNHSLRGIDSDNDEKIVADFCKDNAIPYYTYKLDIAAIAKKSSKSIEQAGRDERYRLLLELAVKLKCITVATAHNANDNLETILLNLTRGTALRGLCGIPYTAVRNGITIIRPLLYTRRDEIELYCKDNFVPFAIDKTNLTTQYTRNKIRLQVTPILQSINPKVIDKISDTTKAISIDNDYLSNVASGLFDKLYSNGIAIDALLAIHPAIRGRIIGILLQKNNVELSAERLNICLEIAENGYGKLNIAKNCYFQAKYGHIFISRNPVEYFEYPLHNGDILTVNGKKYEINIVFSEVFEKNSKNIFQICLDYDRIYGEVVLRQRKTGDKINISNRNVTKSIKKLFNELKLTDYERQTRFVIADSSGVIAVEGLIIDKKVAINEATKRILIITEIQL